MRLIQRIFKVLKRNKVVNLPLWLKAFSTPIQFEQIGKIGQRRYIAGLVERLQENREVIFLINGEPVRLKLKKNKEVSLNKIKTYRYVF